MVRSRAALAALVSIAATLSFVALGQPAPGPQSGSPPVYRPGLGDLMTMTVQPRHIKLALAGREKNWAYAAYELHELEESFERAARAWPKWRSFPIADMLEPLTKGPMAEISQAIKESDANRFVAGYGKLTDACNACHQAAGRGVVAIIVPDASSFPDQDFRPAKP